MGDSREVHAGSTLVEEWPESRSGSLVYISLGGLASPGPEIVEDAHALARFLLLNCSLLRRLYLPFLHGLAAAQGNQREGSLNRPVFRLFHLAEVFLFEDRPGRDSFFFANVLEFGVSLEKTQLPSTFLMAVFQSHKIF